MVTVFSKRVQKIYVPNALSLNTNGIQETYVTKTITKKVPEAFFLETEGALKFFLLLMQWFFDSKSVQ